MPAFDKIRLSLGLLAALAVAGCSDVSVNSPTQIFSSAAANFTAKTKPSPGQRPVTADDLVNPDGQCGGVDTAVAAAPSEAPPGALETRGVGLEETECQVVRRIGHPDRVEIGADPGGARATVMTYLQGPRPGIYHFAGGRLKQIEAAPEPPAPQKPAKHPKRVKPKTATAN